MKNYKNSDYAVNKYSNGIVYRFANQVTEISLSDYLAENPDKTEQDFQELKALSDTIYFNQDRDENAQTKKNASFDELEETSLCCIQSPEESIITALEKAEISRQHLATAKRVLEKLTDIQCRRFLLYHVNGLTMRQIADIEGVQHSKIQNSLDYADKKIKKILSST